VGIFKNAREKGLVILIKEKVIVLDFGAQYAHLIARRVREASVYSELVAYDIPAEKVLEIAPKGIILSGGPSSVYDKGAPKCDPKIFGLDIPVLGICYGLQLMVSMLGGEVAKARKKEYGKAEMSIDDQKSIFAGLGSSTITWMSHGDTPTKLPRNFKAIGHTENSPYAAIQDSFGKLFGIQFHAEVAHTPRGNEILRNFLYKVCRCKGEWTMESFMDNSIAEIKKKVGNENVLCALSGGIDSSTTAVLVHKAVGSNLTCLFVNHGLLRKGEHEQVVKLFKTIGINMVDVDESEAFLKALQNVEEPEKKRQIVGEEFIRAFTKFASHTGSFRWLAQGTLYPDVIESAAAGGPAAKIKTHHNVGGLPAWMEFKLLEPVRDLYKDEVRKLAAMVGVPKEIIERHPFPGPGLAVRVIGAVTKEKLEICREASAIVEEELKRSGLYDKLWQCFAIVGDDKAVGVLGDERKYGYIVTIRAVESVDAMTADWARIPTAILEKISNRITNEVPNVTWVAYAISSKPPATIEPQ